MMRTWIRLSGGWGPSKSGGSGGGVERASKRMMSVLADESGKASRLLLSMMCTSKCFRR